MLGGDDGKPGVLGNGWGWNGCGWIGVPIAGCAIVEFDDLGRGENDEPGLCKLRECAEPQS